MDDDILVFAKENPKDENPKKEGWKVLVADDEKAVHLVTKLALGEFHYEGRPLDLLSAYNEGDVRRIMQEQQDIALVLLDVVMDTVDSGFNLIRFIRDELENKNVRIILRTGQSGTAPEDEVIINYDINDFKDKTELTVSKLRTTIISALKAYSHLNIIEREQKKLLESQLYLNQIIEGLNSALITVDQNMRVHHWNDRALQILDIQEKDIDHRPLSELTQRLDPFLEMLNSCFHSRGRVFKEKIPFPNHQLINISVQPLDLGDGSHLVIRLENVTGQRRRDLLIQRSQRIQTLRVLFQSIQESKRFFETDSREFSLFTDLTQEGSQKWQRVDFVSLLKSYMDGQDPEEFDLQCNIDEIILFGRKDSLQYLLERLWERALEAHKEGLSSQRISLSLSVDSNDEYSPLLPFQEGERRFMILEIRDHGPGLSPDKVEKLFDLKTGNQDSGDLLGLSLAGGIVDAHHGFIDVQSVQGEGTTLRVFLPIDQIPGGEHPRETETFGQNRKSKILVCDDEMLMRQITSSILGRLGFEVLFTSDGYAALEEYEEKKEDIALVILDMLMPGMDGAELFRELKKRDPDVKVILASGFGKFGKIEDALENGAQGYLQKPFGMDSMAAALKQALG